MPSGPGRPTEGIAAMTEGPTGPRGAAALEPARFDEADGLVRMEAARPRWEWAADAEGSLRALPIPVSGGPPGGYNARVEFQSAFDPSLVPAFGRAADFLGRVITGDKAAGRLADGRFVDDLLIDATVTGIDGPGGTLAAAGPTAVRGDGTPGAGIMVFDEADALDQRAAGTWGDVVLHEMLHVVGLGTIWDAAGLLARAGGTLRFTGENAIAAYEDAFPAIAASDRFSARGVPVEEDGGPGTAGGHWDEEVFGRELMTGFVDRDTFVSDLTVASLEDLGYDTVFEPPVDIL